ncbi:MAG: thioredoxin domain-containing protein [Bifidobacteriaceae bacterium]|jgi:protein-disulfide isomerase|nr:thioredoxin domain-containing protein [Bifidobacteriaceae bacterium]
MAKNKRNAKPSQNSSARSNASKQSNAERARVRAEALKAKQQAKDRKLRLIIGGIVLLVAIGVIALILVLVGEFNSKQDEVEQAKTDTLNAVINSENKVTGTTENGGIPIGKDGVFSSNEGVPVVAVFSDFMCPGCGQWSRANETYYIDKAKNGEITLELHPVSLLDSQSKEDQYSSRATEFFWNIAQNDPKNALAVFEALFSSDFQPEENDKYVEVTDAQFVELAKKAGVSDAIAEKAVDKAYSTWTTEVTSYFTANYDIVTPSVYVNGVRTADTSQATIDADILTASAGLPVETTE